MVLGKTFLVGNVNSSWGWSLSPPGEEESAILLSTYVLQGRENEEWKGEGGEGKVS